LHVAAVVTLLEPAGSVAPEPVAATAAPVITEQLGADAVTAARRAFRALSDVLGGGAEAAGPFAQAELLRAVHARRSHGLHRPASGQPRILRSIRELRADKAEFALEVLTGDLRDALAVAHAVIGGDSSPGVVGTARRDYESIGNLRVRGVLTEAIVA